MDSKGSSPPPQKVQMHLTRLDGEFKGLRAQFTEFVKQTKGQQGLTPAQAQSLRQEIAAMRQEAAAGRSQGQAVQALQQEHAAFQRELEALRQVSQGMARVQEIQRDVGAVKSQNEALARRIEGLKGMEQEQAKLKSFTETLTQRLQAMQTMQQEQQQLRRQTEQLSQKVQEFGSMKGEFGSVKGELNDIKQRTRELGRLRDEMGSMKGSAGEASRKLGALEMKMRSGLVPQSELNSLKGEVRDFSTLKNEFQGLRKMLMDSGVLSPKAEPVPEDEHPPVGTLELGEDIFTARLLLKLGFLKAKADTEEALAAEDAVSGREVHGMMKLSFAETSDSDESVLDLVRFDDNVTGIQVPEIAEDGPGYGIVTYGWAFICIFTFVLQVFIIVVMMYYAKAIGDGCLEEEPPALEWWLLHLSKAIATIVAGAMMGKDLLDVLNYWMVSELLLGARRSLETHISAALRLLMIILLAVANAFTFVYYTNPASVWINMTALAFISELGGTVLELAKRGVMGHDISKAITGLNFSLNFMSLYPWWFKYARSVALMVMSVFVMIIAATVFVLPAPRCDP